MTDDPREPFAPLGRIPAVQACRQLIEQLPPKEGLTHSQAVDEVEELCSYRHTLTTVRGAMLEASEALLRDGGLGVVARPGVGWIRMDDAAAVRHAQNHLDKSRRSVVRAGAAATAADPERLSWEERHTRDVIADSARRTQEIVGRRARRLRPLPSSEAG